jgi:CheY-specific phosphatase CheX
MSAPNLVEPATVLPRTAWQGVLCDTAIEVFSIMVGAAASKPEENSLPVVAQITGVVGIAGAVRAVFSLRCSAESAVKIASLMLGVPPDDPGSQKAACDAIGEVCNLVAGFFKAKIGLGEKCSLSVPTIITGQDYQIRSGAGSERLEFPLLFEGAPIWFALEIPR